LNKSQRRLTAMAKRRRIKAQMRMKKLQNKLIPMPIIKMRVVVMVLKTSNLLAALYLCP